MNKFLSLTFILLLFAFSVCETVAQTGGTWRTVAPLPTKRDELAAASVNRELYAVGGLGEGFILLNRVDKYNPATNTWSPVAPMSTAREQLAAAEVNGYIYAVGGWGPPYPPTNVLNTVEKYNPGNNTWSPVAPMLTARTRHAAASVNGKLYAIGGWNGSHSLNTMEVYNPTTDIWSYVTSMPTPRYCLAASVVNGKIYVAGGLSDNYIFLNTVEEYNPTTDTWRQVASIPTERAYHATAEANGKLYVIGGDKSASIQRLNTVEEYNPTTDTWRQVAPMLTGRGLLAAAEVDGKIYAMGGWNDYGFLDVVEEYTPEEYIPSYTITASAGTGGSINPSGEVTVNYGGSQTFTITPDTGYYIADVLVDSASVGAVESYTFSNVTANHTISASFFAIVNVPPVVEAINAPVDPVHVNTVVNASANFTDQNITDTHTAVWDWGDGSTSSGAVTETNGSGSVTGSYTYTAAGVYTVKLTVTDGNAASGESIFQYVVVYDPNAGYVTGGGWINSPAGAYAPDFSLTGKANFGFVSKYQKGATVPTGQTQFNFRVANLNFHSDIYEWLVVAGPKAKYKGTGTINNAGNYGFMLTAIDGAINGGGGTDKFRIKIWDKSNSDAIVYDNQMGDADDADATTIIGGGSIVIHKDSPAAPLLSTPLPKNTLLRAAFPNPANPEVWIPYQISSDSEVVIRIYDVHGRRVRMLEPGHQAAGFYDSKAKAAYWDGRNVEGERVASGIYFYTLQAGNFTATRKLLITR
ncbi:T9SS type A sorting domain-containing protein [Candidatus Poribacteria bacterium]|nr:T9SS type A sorting domain-containing protein [Candidatus Poribacteria bacterium]